MTIDLIISGIALLLSAAGFGLSVKKHGASKKHAHASHRHELGQKYASLAWAYARSQKEASDPAKLRKHAEQAFILADTSADGKRDFNDADVARFLDATK